MTPPGTSYPGPVGAEGRSLQSWAGAVGGRGRAQGLLAKEVLLRRARAQPAHGQGGRPSRQALDKVTLGQGRAHRSLWPPAQAVEGTGSTARVRRSGSPILSHEGARISVASGSWAHHCGEVVSRDPWFELPRPCFGLWSHFSLKCGGRPHTAPSPAWGLGFIIP